MALASNPPGSNQPDKLAFGDMQFSMRTQQLRRNGSIVRLQAQPAKLLALLLSRPGELVSREDVRRELWGEPLSYEFDDALNHAVRSLRTALGDDAREARFIQRVPRLGYRFIAEVRPVDANATANLPETCTNQKPSETVPAKATARTVGWFPLRHAAATALLVTAALFAGIKLAAHSPDAPQITSVRQLTHFGLAVDALTDGERLYVQQEKGGHSTLVEFPLPGGDAATPIPTPFRNVSLLDIAPDHRNLLISTFDKYSDPRAVWLLPLDGSSPRRLGGIFAISAAWSPDGKLIAFAGSTPRLPGALYVAHADGSHIRKLADRGGPIDGWSPDGGHVRFTLTNPATGGMTIWDVGADGTNLHPLVPQLQVRDARWDEGLCCGAWTPDGRYFIFRHGTASSASLWVNSEFSSLFQKGGHTEIYAPPFRINELRLLASSKHVAQAYVIGSKEDRELMVLDPQKGWFVPLLAGTPALHVTWSPNGRSIAFTSATDHSLWLANVDGSARVKVASAPLQAFYSAWSPDGTHIAAQVLPPGKPSKIYLVDAKSGAAELLFGNAPTGESDPSWSPDGRTLLFRRATMDDHGNETSASACTVDLKTRKVATIPGPYDIQSLFWSPNGRYIVGTANSSTDLMLYAFNTRRWKKIASGVFLFRPRWSADSSSIYYQDSRVSEEQPIYRVSVATDKVQEVAGRNQLVDATDSARFAFAGLAPNGEPVISVARGRADVYALQLYLP